MRTGIGYDIHGLQSGEDFILGGIKIDYSKGLVGHSDADVLSHSIGDAILGATGQGDIGKHFPDTSKEYKNISSLILLQNINEKIISVNYEINNIDSTVICESPRLKKYIPVMEQKLAQTLEIPDYDINLKATTNEGFGVEGQKRAVSCISVVTVISVPVHTRKNRTKLEK